jgi:hypothetical protein
VPRFHKAELIAQAQSLLAAEEQSAGGGSRWSSTKPIS